jgi:AcrR family transcriptional regulator
MGTVERKEREKKEMRDLILKAALKLFIKEGYDKLSIRKIANEIEYSPGTIYLYFKDKDEIFFELHNQGFGEFYKRQLAVQHIEDPVERLCAHGREYIKFAMENPEYYDLMFIMRSPVKKIKHFEDWELGNRTYDILKKNISELQKAGRFIGEDIEVIAFSLWSYTHGISSLFVRERLKVIPKDQLKILVEGALDFFRKRMI